MWAFWAAVVSFAKDVFNWIVRRRKTIKDDILAARKVESILESVVHDLDGDRATVFQFHNGEYFYTGNSIDKMTATHEYAVNGISREQIKFAGTFAAPYREFIAGFLFKDIHSVPTVELITDYNTKTLLEERGTRSAYATVMRDRTSKPVGFLLIEYIKKPMLLNPFQEELIKKASTSVYEVLVYGKEKK